MLHGAGIFTNIYQAKLPSEYLYFIDGAYGIDIDRSWVSQGDLGIRWYNCTTWPGGKIIKVWDDGNPYRIQLENGDQVWAPEDSDNFVRRKKAKQDGYAAWDV